MAYGKRSRQQAEEMVRLPDGADVASFLLLFSGHHYQHHASSPDPASAPERVFECKTCNRQFPSFQALGGHRASHKKPRTADGGAAAEPPKPKVHGCSICGLEFAIGQALGGHMRRHRAEAEADAEAHNNKVQRPAPEKACDVAGGICLDLNLTPSENCAKCRSVAVLGGAGQGVHKTLAMLDCSL